MLNTTKRYIGPLLILSGIFVCSIASVSEAQTQLQVDAVTAGGNMATSSNYSVRSSVGQVAVTIASSTNYSAYGGIWPSIFNVKKLTPIDGKNSPPDIPDSYSMEPAYPNPFNPTATIRYALPKADRVRITVYNMLGQRVRVLINKRQNAGHHEVTFHSRQLASGVYLYRIVAGDFTKVKKITLVK